MFVRGKPSLLHKVVFELRYRHGFTYLDRCGKTLNAIMKSSPEWILRSDQVGPNNAPLVSTENQCTFSFSSQKLDFSIEQSPRNELTKTDIEKFAEQVGLVSTLVIDQLSLKEFSRIGLRVWHMFPCNDKAESEKFLTDLPAFAISSDLITAFGGSVTSVGVAVVISGDDRDYRVGFSCVERLALIDLGSELLSIRKTGLSPEQQRSLSRQGSSEPNRVYSQPAFAAMIDIDSSREEPEWPDPVDFVLTSLTESTRRLENSLTRKP